jgi:HAD superfamily hydrolase (TIGR01549 family)
MNFDNDKIRAVVFDYGNTLIEFAAPQIRVCDDALAWTLREMFGSVDAAKLQTIRNRDRRAPYTGEYLENNLAAISKKAIRALYGREPSEVELAEVLRVRYESFVSVVTAPDYLHEFLEELSGRYRLGLLSNYPDGAAIRATLRKIEVEGYFAAVVVSGDVGRVKPHALPFQTILNRMGAAPEECLYVGDNWLGDIQGAKRAGMPAAFMVQWDTPEKFDRLPGDMDADLTLSHLTELLNFL